MFDDSPKNINSLIREGYTITPIAYLSEGWEIFKQNAGGFIGFLIVCFLINLVLTGPAAFVSDPDQVSGVAAAWRTIGSLISSIISAPLFAGFLFVAFKILKQQQTTFGDFFKGFQNGRFLPIFLTSLVSGLLILLSLIPFFILFGLGLIALLASNPAFALSTPIPFSLNPTVAVLLLIGSLLALLPGIYLSIAYNFAIPLVVERRLGFWEAIETSRKVITKQWFSFLGFASLLFLVNVAGVLLCGIGLLVTAPLTICATVAAYRHILGLNLSSEMAV
ncbi:DUF975 family protein [Leptolyngbya sp. FACHB-711]|uniref:DUF975 family protein n=1 Tax=unclassified Leptolyngbya TaxID=2650499 RepID=UPI001688BB46|nr:DUF975 family protein [Leptolyngbya sp. FACHB-711]MBD1849863.1 DUF975 family protein [Cyanobacteria bacterium FACHB-502]MBD2027819.1 DUF975 family protein [Leptolyngbya sp. FACHB-711]